MPAKIRLHKEKIVLFLIFVTQGLLFFTFYFREIYPFYLSHWDQVAYYNNTFHVFEMLRDLRITTALRTTPHMSILPLITSLSYFLFGVSKVNGIVIIFLSWVGMQYFLYMFLRKIWNPYFALAFLGLFLSTITYMQVAGGLADFRTDIFASAFYFIAMIAMIYSKQFTDKRGFNYFIISLFAAIIARMNTIALFGGIIVVYLIYLAFQRKFTPVRWLKSLKGPTWGLGGVSILYLILNLEQFLNYQVISALRGDTNLDVQLALQGLVRGLNIDFVINSMLRNHLGILFFLLIGIAILLGFAFWLLTRNKNSNSDSAAHKEAHGVDIRDALFVSLLFTAIPFIIYTLWAYQSPVVQTMMVSPLIVFCALLTKVIVGKFVKKPLLFCKALALLFLIPGSVNFFLLTSSGVHGGYRNWDNQQISRAHNTIRLANSANAHFMRNNIFEANVLWYPVTGPDCIFMANEAYTEHGVLLNYHGLMGAYLYEFTEQSLHERMVNADIIIIPNEPLLHIIPPLPINNNAAEVVEIVRDFARNRLIYLESFDTVFGELAMFVKPTITLSNAWPDWLATDFSLRIPEYALNRIKEYSFFGNVTEFLDDPLALSFLVSYFSSGSRYPVAFEVITPVIEDGRYAVTLIIPEDKNIYRIELTASNYFIPYEIGLNEDTRQLVLPIPDKSRVIVR